MYTEADATGGLGSFAAELRGVLTEGLRTFGRAELLKRYGPSVFTDLPIVAADGSIRHAGAPTPPPSAAETIGAKLGAALENPFVLVAVAILATVAIARFVRS